MEYETQREIALAVLAIESSRHPQKRNEIIDSYKAHRIYMGPIAAAILTVGAPRTNGSHDLLAMHFGELDHLLYEDSQKLS
jgi:hypothetical protein